MTEMHPALKRLEELCDRIIAGRPPPPPEVAPVHRTQTDYVLPPGVRFLEEGKIVIPGSQEGTVWTVEVQTWQCDCPAHRKWPPCKHIRVLKEFIAMQGLSDG